MLSGDVETIRRARKLRRAMSLPEILLWQELRKRPAGLKFRRQQAARRYVADFYCHAAKLAVEVDGAAHDRGNGPQWDQERDLKLSAEGVVVLRVAARDVLDNLNGTVEYIVTQAGRMITSPPSSGWSTSPQGEEL